MPQIELDAPEVSPEYAETRLIVRSRSGVFILTDCGRLLICGINEFTLRSPNTESLTKRTALRSAGTFNPRSGRVLHALFQHSEFFDPEDLLQLKYETLRALEVESYSVAKASAEFGLTRPTIYQAQAQLEAGGMEGLLPLKRGPRGPHKLTAEVRQYLDQMRAGEPDLAAAELAARVRKRFALCLHPRTIEKALKAGTKRGREEAQ